MEIENTNDRRLKRKNNNIVLYEKDSEDKKDLLIEQEAIMGKGKDDIISKLSGALISCGGIEGSTDLFISIYYFIRMMKVS
ncbi:hypothetical protein [Wolbachia pipientis]|uniref:hypothetical protein n=1 Tax=Wolbachia pipientis TaxID=955 RepID=UPI0025A4BBF5|nr:hypothetical protein [Wolbachia pipientis]MDM8335287.1 hypothetical protein [Wolbachia pipientis]